jgi:hypothetical protein
MIRSVLNSTFYQVHIIWKSKSRKDKGRACSMKSSIQKEIERILDSGNAYYYLSVQNHFSSRLLSINVKFRMNTKNNFGCSSCMVSDINGETYEVWLLHNGSALTLPRKVVKVGSVWNVIDLKASRIEQDWNRLSISVGLPMRFECDRVVLFD